LFILDEDGCPRNQRYGRVPWPRSARAQAGWPSMGTGTPRGPLKPSGSPRPLEACRRGAALCRPRRREGTKEKAPPKEGRDQHLGTRGDGLPSRCIRRYRLPSRCTRKKFHARPEQGNGPAADGASFSLTLKFIGVRKEPLFPSGTKTIRGLGNRSARFHHPHPSTVCVPRAWRINIAGSKRPRNLPKFGREDIKAYPNGAKSTLFINKPPMKTVLGKRSE
jgi:hypothetical protein